MGFFFKRLNHIVWILAIFGHSLFAQINTDQVMSIGKNALYFDDYVLSIQYFNKVISAKPYLSEPYFVRAYAKYNLEDWQGALTDCDKVLTINPYMVDAYNLRGIINLKLNENEKALVDFSAGLKIDTKNINLLINSGNSYMSLKKYDLAIVEYSKAIESDPKLVSIYYNRAIAKINQSDTIGAMTDFTTVIEKNPYISDGFTGRGLLYYQKGEFSKAIEDYNTAIKLNPDDAGLYLNRSVYRYQLDDFKGCLSDLDKVLEIDPKNVTAYSNRGILKAQVGDYNRAVEDYSRVLALKPSDYLTLLNRAMVYNKLGQYKLALNDLNILAERYPKFAPIYQTRSYTRSMLNDKAGADIDYLTAYKLEKDQEKLAQKQDAINDKLVSNSASSETKNIKKETRSDFDSDIKNFNKIAVLNDFETKNTEDTKPLESIRGKIQNKDIFVELEPSFCVTFYTADTLLNRPKYYDLDVVNFNRKRWYKQPLVISNSQLDYESQESLSIFKSINDINQNLEEDSTQFDKQFSRAVLLSMIVNYTRSLEDYNQLIKTMPKNKLVYLNRAWLRYKMVEAIRTLDNNPLPDNLTIKSRISAPKDDVKNSLNIKGSETIIDYDLVQRDLEKAIELDPRFSFAYYNLGVLKLQRRDITGATTNFDKAIELNPDLGEAYFNRGLIRLYQKQEKEGTIDLSKAGELGVFKAYNVIKRYGYTGEDKDNEGK